MYSDCSKRLLAIEEKYRENAHRENSNKTLSPNNQYKATGREISYPSGHLTRNIWLLKRSILKMHRDNGKKTLSSFIH